MTRRCCGSISSASAGDTPSAAASNRSAPVRKEPNCWFSSAWGKHECTDRREAGGGQQQSSDGEQGRSRECAIAQGLLPLAFRLA